MRLEKGWIILLFAPNSAIDMPRMVIVLRRTHTRYKMYNVRNGMRNNNIDQRLDTESSEIITGLAGPGDTERQFAAYSVDVLPQRQVIIATQVRADASWAPDCRQVFTAD